MSDQFWLTKAQLKRLNPLPGACPNGAKDMPL